MAALTLPSTVVNTASALRLGLKAALGLALFVLLAHSVVLWWARSEMQSVGFASPNKIIYSRMIVPATPAPELPAAAPTPVVKPAAPRPKPAPKLSSSKAVQAVAPVVDPPALAAPEAPQALPREVPNSEPLPSETSNTQSSIIELPPENVRNKSIPNTSIYNEAIIPWPPTTRISYDLSGQYRGELHGSGAFEWIRDKESGYQLFLRVKSLVGIEYRSRGTFDDKTLKPLRYEEQLPRGVTAVSFDHVTSKVSFSRITDVIDMTPEMQDRASAIMQLVHIVMSDPQQLPVKLDRGERIKLSVAGPTGADGWEFEIKGREEVVTGESSKPIKLNAWHLQRVPRKPNGDLGVDLWLSDQLQGMPVRIKLTLSADTYLDLTMIKAEQQ